MNSSGAQDWRAIAIIAAGSERLLCLGESASQVRAAYIGAWSEVIRDEDRPTVKQISLQKWAGKVWQGQWEHQDFLKVPNARGGIRSTDDGSLDEVVDLESSDISDLDLDAELDQEALMDEVEVEADVDADAEPESDEE